MTVRRRQFRTSVLSHYIPIAVVANILAGIPVSLESHSNTPMPSAPSLPSWSSGTPRLVQPEHESAPPAVASHRLQVMLGQERTIGQVTSRPNTLNVTTVGVGQGPEDSVYDNGNGYVYVPNSASNNVSVIDGTTVISSIAVGSHPWSATYDATNGYVYVPNSGSGNVSVINGAALIGSVNVGLFPHYATYDSANGYIYVPNAQSGNVSVINGTKVIGSVHVGGTPWFPIYDIGNGYVYLTNYTVGSTTVAIISGLTLAGIVAVGSRPWSLEYDPGNGYVYVPNILSDNVSVINGAGVIGSVDVGSEPYYACYNARDDLIYVPNAGSNNVSVINGTRDIASVAVGANPEFAAYDNFDGGLYVPNGGSNNVSVIQGEAVINSFNAGANPNFVSIDSNNGFVYVVNFGSNDLSVLFDGYFVSFTESGLPLSTEWWVNVTGGSSTHSKYANLSFSEPSGSYNYSVSTTDRAYASPGGTFSVKGSPLFVRIGFSPVKYNISFLESGLPLGTDWSVSFDGNTSSSTSPLIGFAEPDGTYPYTLGSIPGWTTPGFAGTVSVNGQPVWKSINWIQATYVATFTETGLPAHARWSVDLGGVASDSTSSSIVFKEPNGTYSYALGSIPGWRTSNPEGSISVSGNPVPESVPWTEVAYHLTFVGDGLPNGTDWAVTLNGSTRSGTGVIDFAGIPNGSYSFAVVPLTGYAETPSNGRVIVNGPPAIESISFKSTQTTPPNGSNNGPESPRFLGIPALEGYAILGGGVLTIVVALFIGRVLNRQRGPPPELETS